MPNGSQEKAGIVNTNSVKKFSVPCLFGSVKYPFTLYIGAPNDRHPFHYQAKWLAETRGGVIPEPVMESIEKLKVLAVKNNVNFQDLAVDALIDDNVGKPNSQEVAPVAVAAVSNQLNFISDSRNYTIHKIYLDAKEYYQAKQSQGYAKYNLALYYEFDRKLINQESTAQVLFQAAAEHGDPRAQYRLFQNEEKKYSKKSLDYLIPAAVFGVENAAYNLAVMLDVSAEGRDLLRNTLIPAYQKKAEQGNPQAMVMEAFLTYLLDETNLEKIMSAFEKAGECGNAIGYYQLGRLYERGLGVSKDHLKALHYYELAAAQDHFYAAEKAGSLYMYGKAAANGISAIAVDKEKAAIYYGLAAKHGLTKEIAWCYWLGNGVAIDYQRAAEYTEQYIAGVDKELLNNEEFDFNLLDALVVWYEKEKQYDKVRELNEFSLKKHFEINNHYSARVLIDLARFYYEGLGNLKVDSSKAQQLCEYYLVHDSSENDSAKAYALYHIGKIYHDLALKNKSSSHMIKSKECFTKFIKVSLGILERDNLIVNTNYRIGCVIKHGYLDNTELSLLGVSQDAEYYFLKATQSIARGIFVDDNLKLSQQYLVEYSEAKSVTKQSDASASPDVSDTQNIEVATETQELSSKNVVREAAKDNTADTQVRSFSIPCRVGNKTQSFTLSLGKPGTNHPFYFQGKWLKDTKNGVITDEVLTSIEKLKDLAIKNKVSFQDLCVYALSDEAGNDEASKPASEPKQAKKETDQLGFIKDIHSDTTYELCEKVSCYYKANQSSGYAKHYLGNFYMRGDGVTEAKPYVNTLIDVFKELERENKISVSDLYAHEIFDENRNNTLSKKQVDDLNPITPTRYDTLYDIYTQLKEHYQKSSNDVVDDTNANALCELAAEQGVPWAQYHLYTLNSAVNKGAIKDIEKALHYLLMAVINGFDEAYHQLAIILDTNEQYKDLLEKTLRPRYKEKAAEGDSLAITIESFLSLWDADVVLTEVMAEFEKAGELGNSAAYYQLGRLYENQFGLTRDGVKATHYYELAAANGHCYAAEKAGFIYSNGDEVATGVSSNKEKAADYYKLAAEQGLMESIAWSYWHGSEVAADYKLAAEYTERYIASIDTFSYSNVEFNFDLYDILAMWYESQSQPVKAKDLYVHLQAKIHNKYQQYYGLGLIELARYHYEGLGNVNVDNHRAVRLCEYYLKHNPKESERLYASYSIGKLYHNIALADDAFSDYKDKARECFIDAAKLALAAIANDEKNMATNANYRIGRIIQKKYLTHVELEELGITQGENYYFLKAANTNNKSFYAQRSFNKSRQYLSDSDNTVDEAVRQEHTELKFAGQASEKESFAAALNAQKLSVETGLPDGSTVDNDRKIDHEVVLNLAKYFARLHDSKITCSSIEEMVVQLFITDISSSAVTAKWNEIKNKIKPYEETFDGFHSAQDVKELWENNPSTASEKLSEINGALIFGKMVIDSLVATLYAYQAIVMLQAWKAKLTGQLIFNQPPSDMLFASVRSLEERLDKLSESEHQIAIFRELTSSILLHRQHVSDIREPVASLFRVYKLQQLFKTVLLDLNAVKLRKEKQQEITKMLLDEYEYTDPSEAISMVAQRMKSFGDLSGEQRKELSKRDPKSYTNQFTFFSGAVNAKSALRKKLRAQQEERDLDLLDMVPEYFIKSHDEKVAEKVKEGLEEFGDVVPSTALTLIDERIQKWNQDLKKPQIESFELREYNVDISAYRELRKIITDRSSEYFDSQVEKWIVETTELFSGFNPIMPNNYALDIILHGEKKTDEELEKLRKRDFSECVKYLVWHDGIRGWAGRQMLNDKSGEIIKDDTRQLNKFLPEGKRLKI